VASVSNAKEEAYNMRREGMTANQDAAKALKQMLKKGEGRIQIPFILSFQMKDNLVQSTLEYYKV